MVSAYGLSCRSAVPGGFTLDDFTVDEAAGTLTCPAGRTRPIASNRKVKFGSLYSGCPLRPRCTTAAAGRAVLLHEHEALLRMARRQAQTPEFEEVYRRHRPTAERPHWSTAGTAQWPNGPSPGSSAVARKVRYRGVARNNQWLHHRTVALNLRRLLALGLTRQASGWAIA